jgi:flagellar M-ring protein FliF
LTSLVQGAVGFNATRGDVVNLISTSFEPPAPVTPLPVWQQPQYLDVAKYLLVALAIALVGFLVVRPIINRVTYIPPPPMAAQMSPDEMKAALIASGELSAEALVVSSGAAAELAGAAGGVESAEAETIEMREGESMEEFKSRLKARLKPKKKAGISAEMLDTANSYDDKVTVVRMMVEQDAKRVALVLKNLITRDLS